MYVCEYLFKRHIYIYIHTSYMYTHNSAKLLHPAMNGQGRSPTQRRLPSQAGDGNLGELARCRDFLWAPSIYRAYNWVAVKELKLSYHSSETIFFTIYPCYGSSFYVP